MLRKLGILVIMERAFELVAPIRNQVEMAHNRIQSQARFDFGDFHFWKQLIFSFTTY